LGYQSRIIRWAKHVAYRGERRGAPRVLEVKCDGKRPCEKPRHRWKDNMKMDLQQVRWVHQVDCSESG
jgi:hypothetical protein